MKSFTTEDNPIREEGEEYQFEHDGTECVFFEPTPEALSVIMTVRQPRAGREVSQQDAARLMRFIFGIMDDETLEYFEERLLDPRDNFSLTGKGGLLDLFDWFCEEVSGKASKQPQDFQPKQQRTGRSSTGSSRARASTSTRSRARASSTPSSSGD